MKTTAKKLSVLILSVVLLLAAAIPAFAAQSPAVSVVTDKTSVNVGDIVNVKIDLAMGSPVNAFQAILKYDTASFEYQADSAKCVGIFEAFNSVNVRDEAGEIEFATMSNVDDDFTAGGTILTASFKVLKVNGEISLDLKKVGKNDFDSTDITSLTDVKNGTVKIVCAHAGAKEETVKRPLVRRPVKRK